MSFGHASPRVPKMMDFLASGPAYLFRLSPAARFQKTHFCLEFHNFIAADTKDEAGGGSKLSVSGDITADQSERVAKINSAVVASNLYRIRMQQANLKADCA